MMLLLCSTNRCIFGWCYGIRRGCYRHGRSSSMKNHWTTSMLFLRRWLTRSTIGCLHGNHCRETTVLLLVAWWCCCGGGGSGVATWCAFRSGKWCSMSILMFHGCRHGCFAIVIAAVMLLHGCALLHWCTWHGRMRKMMVASVLLAMHKLMISLCWSGWEEILSRDTTDTTTKATLLSRPWSRHNPIGMMMMMMKRMMITIVGLHHTFDWVKLNELFIFLCVDGVGIKFEFGRKIAENFQK